MSDAAAFFTSSGPKEALASVRPFSPERRAANTFRVTASALDDLAAFMQSLKCSNICTLCLLATFGNTQPNRNTDESMTATPNGSGPGEESV